MSKNTPEFKKLSSVVSHSVTTTKDDVIEKESAVDDDEAEFFQQLNLSKATDASKDISDQIAPTRKQPLTRYLHSALINSGKRKLEQFDNEGESIESDEQAAHFSVQSRKVERKTQESKLSQYTGEELPTVESQSNKCDANALQKSKRDARGKNVNLSDGLSKSQTDDENVKMRHILKLEMEKGTDREVLKQEQSLREKFSSPPYCCSVESCTSEFSRWDKFMRHVREHSGLRPYTCVRCSSKFKHRSDLMSHLKRHIGIKSIKCDLCEKTFEKRCNLVAHKIANHGVHDRRPRKFKCTECGDAFLSKMAVDRHMRCWHTGYRPKACDTCGATFHTEYDLKDHLRIHSGEKPCKCDECDYCARTMQLLNRHKRSHLNEKPFTCKECEFSCNNAGSLKRHALKHSGKKPYKCPYCEHRCSDLDNLKKHIRKVKKHQGLKTYRCSHCPYFSTDDGNEYLRHMKQYHFPYLDLRSSSATKVSGILIEEADDMADITGNNLLDEPELLHENAFAEDSLSLDAVPQSASSSVLQELTLKSVDSDYSGIVSCREKGDILLSSVASHDNHVPRKAGAFSSALFGDEPCMDGPFPTSVAVPQHCSSNESISTGQDKASEKNAEETAPVANGGGINMNQEYVAVLVNWPSDQKVELQEGNASGGVPLTLVINSNPMLLRPAEPETRSPAHNKTPIISEAGSKTYYATEWTFTTAGDR